MGTHGAEEELEEEGKWEGDDSSTSAMFKETIFSKNWEARYDFVGGV